MFAKEKHENEVVEQPSNEPESEIKNKYKNVLTSQSSPIVENNEMNYNAIDALLEREKQNNKNENWNKLEKSLKIQKLHIFAEKYGRENGMPVKDIKSLKTFFIDCLEKNKLQKTKEVNYDKDSKEIISIPALHFNVTNRNFTLKIVDAKRVSTLKSLTPKRSVEDVST
jgi:hypothetical protein